MKIRTIILASTLACSFAQAQQTYSFDSSSELTDNFTLSDSGFTHNSTGGNPGGFIGTGNILAGATETTAFQLDLSQDQNISFGIDFLTADAITSTRRSLLIGLTSVDPATTPFDYSGGGLYNNTSIVAGTRGIDGSDVYGYSFGQGNASFQDTGSSTDALSANTWHNLQFNLSYRDASNDFVGQLIISSADGLSEIRDLSFGGAIANPWGADETITAYSVIAGRNISSSIAGFDNFVSPVPEPSSYALIAGSLALGWIMIRRRK